MCEVKPDRISTTNPFGVDNCNGGCVVVVRIFVFSILYKQQANGTTTSNQLASCSDLQKKNMSLANRRSKRSLNSGSRTPRPRAWRHMTDVDLTWSSTASRLGEGHCAATQRWCPPCRGRVCRRAVLRMKTGPHSPRPSAASRPHIPSCCGAVPSALCLRRLVRLRRLRAPPALRFTGHGLGTPLVDAAVRSRPARDGAVGGWAGLAGSLSRSSGRSACGACAGLTSHEAS